MTKQERAVLRAAVGCVNEKGFAFLYARDDVNRYIIDRTKFQRLEKAVATLRAARRKKRG